MSRVRPPAFLAASLSILLFPLPGAATTPPPSGDRPGTTGPAGRPLPQRPRSLSSLDLGETPAAEVYRARLVAVCHTLADRIDREPGLAPFTSGVDQLRTISGQIRWVEINLNRISAIRPLLLAVLRDVTERLPVSRRQWSTVKNLVT